MSSTSSGRTELAPQDRSCEQLTKTGLTELFFESSEPTLDEVPLEDSFWRDSRRENTSSRARELMEFLWQAM
jgi:hypothetical protein